MDLNIYPIPNGLNPPLPALPAELNDDMNNNDGLGPRLMALVRSGERCNHKKVGDLHCLLRAMMELFSRKGLLQGNKSKAEKLLASRPQSSGVGGGTSRKKGMGNKARNNGRDDLRIINESENLEKSGDGTIADSEQLIIAALSRILGGGQDLASPRTLAKGPDLVSIQLAAGVCLAISQHVRIFISGSPCALAEYELLATSGKCLLTGFARTMKGLLSSGKTRFNESDEALKLCLTSATSLISLFGNKLARSSPIVECLRSVGWQAILQSNENVQQGAARLLSSLTLTGIDNVAPSDAWSLAFSDGVSAIMMVIKAVAPVNCKTSQFDLRLSAKTQTTIGDWLDQTREKLPDEGSKVLHFRTCVNGLVGYIVALLQREFVDSHCRTALNASLIPMEELLELLEYLLSYPSAAESAYYGTKKRLRLETIQDGLLSPYAIATDVANFIKAMGQTIFQVVLDGLGRSPLLQYGRRITSLSHASFQTSCSTALRKAVDPGSAIGLDVKRRRWLHQSVFLRTKGVQNARSVIVVLGSNMVVESSNSSDARRNRNSNEGGKMILLLAGCVLEQVGWDGTDDDWGTLKERVGLATAAMDALTATLNSCGGFLPFKMRSLVDSTALTCLNEYVGKSSSKVSRWSQAKVAALNFGLTCISIPWQDSAMSALTPVLRETARVLVKDSNHGVSALALHCLQLCNLQSTFRAPPLCVATRSTPGGQTDRCVEIESASIIVDSLKAAKDEIAKDDVKSKVKPKRTSKECDDDRMQKYKKAKSPPSFLTVETENLHITATIKSTEPVPVEPEVSSQETNPLVEIIETADDERFMSTESTSADQGEEGEFEEWMPGIVDCGPDGDDED